MINIRNLPDAWEMIDRLGGEDAKAKESLFNIYYQISTTLFDYRLKYNLSQKQLAERLGVTQPMVAKLESGDYNYTIEQLWKIAQKLDFKFDIDFEEVDNRAYSVVSHAQNQDQENIDDYELKYLVVGS